MVGDIFLEAEKIVILGPISCHCGVISTKKNSGLLKRLYKYVFRIVKKYFVNGLYYEVRCSVQCDFF